MSTSPKSRTDALAGLGPRGLYLDHVTNVRSPACGCTVDTPDYSCDLGWALFRVAKAEKSGRKSSAPST